MTTATEERLELIRAALFPVLEDDYCDICGGPCCPTDPFDFEDQLGPDPEADEEVTTNIAETTLDGVLQGLESLILIAKTGSDHDAVLASTALLDFGLAILPNDAD